MHILKAIRDSIRIQVLVVVVTNSHHRRAAAAGITPETLRLKDGEPAVFRYLAKLYA